MEETKKSLLDDSFTSAMTLTNSGVPQVPPRYVLLPSQRPALYSTSDQTTLPVIDLSSLHQPLLRSRVIHQISIACKEFGFFQVINHGIPSSVVKDAMDAATQFFDLPVEEKMLLVSANVHKPVRYGTSINHSTDKVHYWRDFIKHYSHPLSKWINMWPSNPPCYRDKVGQYAEATHVLHKHLIEAISEGLGLDLNYLQEESEEGSQVMAVNCYPACPEPEIALGMPPHSDFSSLTILLQSSQGLQIMDCNKNWVCVPYIEGALIVQLGDHVEVMSNGIYKSVIHCVTVNKDVKRLSFASLHKKISPAPVSSSVKTMHLHMENLVSMIFLTTSRAMTIFYSKDSLIHLRRVLPEDNGKECNPKCRIQQGNFHDSSFESSLRFSSHGSCLCASLLYLLYAKSLNYHITATE